MDNHSVKQGPRGQLHRGTDEGSVSQGGLDEGVEVVDYVTPERGQGGHSPRGVASQNCSPNDLMVRKRREQYQEYP